MCGPDMECEEGSAWHARARPLRSLNAIALTRTSSSVLAGTAECASGIRYWILLSLLEDRLKMCMLKSNQGLARLEVSKTIVSDVFWLQIFETTN